MAEHAFILKDGLLLRAVRKLLEYESLPMVHNLFQLVDWDGEVFGASDTLMQSVYYHRDFRIR